MNKFISVSPVLAVALQLTLAVPASAATNFSECAENCEITTGALSSGQSHVERDLPRNTEKDLPTEHLTLWSLKLENKVAAKEASVQVEEMVVLSSSGSGRAVNFRSGKAEIDPGAAGTIKKLIDRLKQKKNLRMHFIGHTDNERLSARARKIYRDNQHLSEDRAEKVAAYFKAQLGLTSESVSTSGKSFNEPIGDNNTPDGMSKNRRVEMKLWYDQPQVAKKVTAPQPMSRSTVCGGELEVSSLLEQFKGFKITVDGKEVEQGNVDTSADAQRCTDVALEKSSIQLQYDNLTAKPSLNVTASPATAQINTELEFQGYSNYLGFIKTAEVRIFQQGVSTKSKPLAVVVLDDALRGSWKLPEDFSGKLDYRLRVYDSEKRFDETSSLRIWVIDHDNDDTTNQQKNALLAGYGENHLELSNIKPTGGMLTVNGSNVPADHKVYFLGREIPVSDDASFVAQQIVGDGLHRVEVAVLNDDKNGELFWRDLRFDDDDWFVVALADFTIGQNSTTGPARLVTGDEQHFDDDLYTDGRLAFYAKGKKGKYRITASVDSREEPLDELFRNLDDKSPQQLLRRLDEEDHYPVYGDDSTVIEDAPTQGKVYLKVEDDYSHLLWGNFKTGITDTDLAKIERGLYGVQLELNSEAVTSKGETKTSLQMFVAEPGTLASREEMRGTGGSLYYLQHQDITRGSERVRIEVRDKDSDIVLQVTPLIAGQDYDIDSLQGRILLTSPLSSTSNDNLLIRAGGVSGHSVYLVVNYEYTALLQDLDELAIGGRLSHWIDDGIQLGITSSKQDQTGGDQELLGVDLLFRKTEKTYLKIEAAQTQGSGIGAQGSIDGGYFFNQIDQQRAADPEADGVRVETGFVFQDLGFENDGAGTFYYQQRDAGFSAPGQLTRYDTEQFGGSLGIATGEESELILKFDLRDETGGRDTTAVEVDYLLALSDNWDLKAGVRVDDLSDDSGFNTNIGERTDLALEFGYESKSDWSAYGFIQATLEVDGNRRDNDRIGFGGKKAINDKLAFEAEISTGDGGLGGMLGTDYRISDDTNIYLNYEMDTDRTDNGFNGRNGQLVSGARTRYNESTSIYGEERMQHGDGPSGLTHAYGVDYIADDYWRFGSSIEKGELTQLDGSSLERTAVAFSYGYEHENLKYGGSIEYREDTTQLEERTTWLMRNNLGYQVDEDWRAQLRVDAAMSESGLGDFFNGDFVETVAGFAYRPVDNDRLNALIKYTYLADQAPADQFTASGQQNDFEQKSHVFSIDAIYDLNSRWSIGGKYATRTGEIRLQRGAGEWFDSTADLFIVRADWHVVRRWDLMLEGRMLKSDLAEDKRKGMLAGLYRHFGENLKVGVGYNFTDFSDDLTDLDFDSKGWFLNIIGKY